MKNEETRATVNKEDSTLVPTVLRGNIPTEDRGNEGGKFHSSFFIFRSSFFISRGAHAFVVAVARVDCGLHR